MAIKAIGIDLGGTRIKGVSMDAERNILQQLYTPTQDGDNGEWKRAVEQTVRQLLNGQKQNGVQIGISAPGLPNQTNRAIAFMPGRLQGLENFDWSCFLKQSTWVLNDAVSALMAEARLGIAKDQQNVVMLTLGTGVGGSILINGKLYQGAFNKAGHMGHMVIHDDGDPDVAGMPGSLEAAIGNCTIEKRSDGRFSSTHQLLEAFQQGDPIAKEIWLLSIKKLAIGLASITNILSPETIVLGGGITEAGDFLFEPLKEFMDLYEWRAGGNQVAIVKAHFGDMAGAIGAACYAMESVDT